MCSWRDRLPTGAPAAPPSSLPEGGGRQWPGRSGSTASAWVLSLCAVLITLVALGTSDSQAAPGGPYPGIGRAATPAEVAAWDIDVRPDFQGLPRGSGSVAQGQQVWESQCASCHGVFGESNAVFQPLVGGTTAADVGSGHAARLRDGAYPQRSTLMKVATVSTLWDYIRRAMPWNAPKSLNPDQVYAVTAYLLNLGGVLPDDFVLSDQTIAQAQARLPNRLGMTQDHGLWPGRGQPDVRATPCMRDCGPAPQVASQLPPHARNQHGNLAEQNRLVGPQRGAETAVGEPSAGGLAAAPSTPASASGASQALGLLQQHACTGCHGMNAAVVGPGFSDIARRHAARADAAAYLAGRIRSGGSGNWGQVPMPPQNLGDDDARAIARWLAAGAPQ